MKVNVTISVIFLASALLSCAEEHGHHHGANDANQHMHRRSFEELVKSFENEDRSAWQKPDEVIALLGDLNGKTVMDIGAGSGYFTFRMAAKGARVIAADVDQRFLDFITEKRKQLNNILF